MKTNKDFRLTGAQLDLVYEMQRIIQEEREAATKNITKPPEPVNHTVVQIMLIIWAIAVTVGVTWFMTRS